MIHPFRQACKACLQILIAGYLIVCQTVHADLAQGEKGIVASCHPLASEAGIEVMKHGGNAIDAAVAIALTLGVVDGHNSGIGGGCFMLIRRANGEFIALDGREMAPASATRDMYLRGGKGDTELSQTGALASGVPGAIAVYEQAVKQFGHKTLADLIFPAAQLAEDGFPINHVYAARLKATANKLLLFESPKAIFFKADGTVLKEGELLKQTDLGKSYQAIAEHGSSWFYGDYARIVAAWMKEHGGLLTEADFRNYTVRQRQPLRTTYRDYEIIGMPPPSSGGVHVAQILNILENFNLKAASAPGARHHLIAEAMKLAFADRTYWLGDPDFVKVPFGLVDKAYGRELATRINPDHTTTVPNHGMPPDAGTRLFEKHTTHFSTADAEGNWVACTATINTSFGSKVIVPGTGILLNNQMDDFSIDPGVPNSFKLVGAEANAIAPGKRPLSSMSPTIVLKDGQPILAVGAAGGPTIISQTVLNIIAVLDLGQPLDEALAQPRIHQQWQPDQLRIEKALPNDIREALKKLGHQLFEENTFGTSQAVGRSADGKGFVGAGDPGAGGKAAGF